MNKSILLLLLSMYFIPAAAQDKPAYILYNQEGKEVKYSKMLKELEQADVVFFGELHTDPIAHWLQLELTKALHKSRGEDLILGAEMFEADGQVIMDEYLAGLYPEDKFEAGMRLWNNYETDYKPVVEYAKENGIPYIATNIPRRYASMVHKGGFEALDQLSDEAKAWIAPLPFPYDPELPGYKNMLDMGKMGGPGEMPAMPESDSIHTKKLSEAMHGTADTIPADPKAAMPAEEVPMAMPAEGAPMAMPPSHGKGMPAMAKSTLENLPRAQAAKDATMAHFILENWEPGKLMFHFNGSYHSKDHEGIIWYLLQDKPGLKILTISTVLQEDISELETGNREADYVICVPETMTRTGR